MVAESAALLREVRTAVGGVVAELAPDPADPDRDEARLRTGLKRLGDLGYLDVGGSDGLGLAGDVVVVSEVAQRWGSLALAALPSILVRRTVTDLSDDDPIASVRSVLQGAAVAGLAVCVEGGEALGEVGVDQSLVRGRLTGVLNGADAVCLLLMLSGNSVAPHRVLFAENSSSWQVNGSVDYEGFRSVAHSDLDVDGRLRAVGDGNVCAELIAADRVLRAGVAWGLARSALEQGVRYAQQRSQFGAPIGSYGEIQAILARASTQVHSAGAAVADQASEFDAGRRDLASATRTFLIASKAAVAVGERVQHVHGGYGHMAEFGIGRLVRESSMLAASAGSALGHDRVLARDLGLPEPSE